MDPTTRMYVSTRFYLFVNELRKKLDIPSSKITEMIVDVLKECTNFEEMLERRK